MYGIKTEDGDSVVCQRSGTNVYTVKSWGRCTMPAHRSKLTDIQQLLEKITRVSKRKFIVFRFTEEQVEKILIRKLQGF